MTAPTIPFPTPPATPLSGSFPKRWWNPEIGLMNEPTVPECSYPFDPLCISNPYLVGGTGITIEPGYEDPDDEDWEEHQVLCPTSKSTTTTTTKPATTTTTVAIQIPTEIPLIEGDHTNNTVSCYKKGEKTEHGRMESAAKSFCNSISKIMLKRKMVNSHDYPFDWNGGIGTVTIKISLEILHDTCEYLYSETSCLKYLSIPTDSCDCSGINNKHGGTVSNNCYTWRIDPQWSV